MAFSLAVTIDSSSTYPAVSFLPTVDSSTTYNAINLRATIDSSSTYVTAPTSLLRQSFSTSYYYAGYKLTTPRFGEAQLLEHTQNPTGGAKVGGGAYVVGDPLLWTANGGVNVGGAATVQAILLLNYSVSGSGGLVAGGTAPMTSYALNPTIDATLPVPTCSMSGQSIYLRGILPVLTSSMSGLVGIVGTMGSTFPAMTGSFAGGSPNMTMTLPSLVAAMAGAPGIIGTMAATLPPLTSDFEGTPPVVGMLAAQLPTMGATLGGIVGNVGDVNAVLPELVNSFSAYAGVVGNIDADLPVPLAAFGGYESITGTMGATLPSLQATFLGTTRETQQLIMVTNTVTGAVSFYEGIQVNSMAAFNDTFLSADSTGIHVMDADDDNSVQIDAMTATGILDLGSIQQKRISDMYAGMRAAGDLTLSVSVDENVPYDYTLSPENIATLKARRVMIGKGLRGKYWQFTLANTEGCDFDFDSLDFSVTDTDRRI